MIKNSVIYLDGFTKEIQERHMVYLVFIHTENGLLYGGYFSTRKNAEAVCKAWNEANENESQFADFINVTNEKDNIFILRK